MHTYKENEMLLSINNLHFNYGNKNILRDIGNSKFPFCIMNISRAEVENQGQIIAVVGRSGRGKSTLFKALTGIIEPHKGEIKIIDSVEKKEYRNIKEGDMGFVQQNYPLSRNQSIVQMLNDGIKQSKTFQKNSKEIVEAYLKEWGLWEQRNQCTCQLSGGQKQRVAIIEQILCEHYFMLFDEPFSGLDVQNVDDVKKSFEKLNFSNDINTLIFSTHDIELAVEIADTIYVLGYEYENKNPLPGGTIVGYYDLKKLGLAWKPYSSAHQDLVNEVKNTLRKS